MTPTAMFLFFLVAVLLGGALGIAGLWLWLVISWSKNN